MQADLVISNVHIASMDPAIADPYGAVRDGALALGDGKILWLGRADDMPAITADEYLDGGGRWLTPGLIDCHTHLVYGGNRAQEFEDRLQGLSYEQIAQRGGGIVSTVTATRAASAQQLYQSAAKRLQALLREGVTCIEIKSGYGLNTATELAMLRTARELGQNHAVKVCTTFLGAHALPPEYHGRSDDYIALVCDHMLPAVAAEQLADAVDVFCEGVGFSSAQCRRVFERAQALGLPVKGHVEQLSYLGGARLVAEFNGLSADHVEYLPAADVALLAQHNVVPVLLPGAYYFLRETQLPPIQAMRDAGLPMAVASDLNPGTSPAASLLLNMNMACIQFRLTPAEVLAGVTRNAALALGLGASKGQLRAGFDADLLLWSIDHPAELSYAVNMHHPDTIIVGGQRV